MTNCLRLYFDARHNILINLEWAENEVIREAQKYYCIPCLMRGILKNIYSPKNQHVSQLSSAGLQSR
jgi:hypothetical protein